MSSAIVVVCEEDGFVANGPFTGKRKAGDCLVGCYQYDWGL